MALAIEILCALVTLAGLVYLTLTLRATRSYLRFWRANRLDTSHAPTITVLKPMKGTDAGLYAALESHCTQTYSGRYEILFGVSSMDDPAVAEIDRLRTAFPAVAMRTIHCTQRLGTSGKVSNLSQMLPHALGEIVIVNDSDIHVGPSYLANIAAAFRTPGKGEVGMVTVPYFGLCAAPATLPAKLEALTISTDFFPSVLTARMLEGGIRFGLGSTLAVPRKVLDQTGGFLPLVEHLADDYELGARVAAAGYRVELLPEIVSTGVPRYAWSGFWNHQLRWARCVRDSRRAGYIGLSVTHALPWALATCIASGFELWSFTLLSIVLLARVAVALTVGVGILRDGQVLRDLWLLPIRDCLALLLWAWSYADDTILWRGERFRLDHGKLVHIE